MSYILTDKSRSTLYIGITNDLVTRLWQRASFSQRYRYILLMHVEHHGDVKRGHRTGETVKGWRRAKKIALIEKENPRWEDLAADW